MTSLADPGRPVTGGVDTHKDTHVAVVVDEVGRVLGTKAFPADARGYVRLHTWMASHGALVKVGVEGTGSYGAGLARHLGAEGVTVVEVVRPNRQVRRRRGKSDPTDAEAAARAALNGEASGAPKSRDGAVEALRALRVARRGAVKARTQAANQLRDLIVSAPESLRSRLGPLPTDKRVKVAARFRPGSLTEPVEATKAAMRSLAVRHQDLSTEIDRLDEAMGELVPEAAPKGLLDKQGVGPQVAATLLATAGDNPGRLRSDASFAALCGASPVDASSGKQVRHRLNRGGDRQANSALWRIVHTRMAHDPRTKAYVQRRTAEGKTTKEIVRCLKRYVARELYRCLVARDAQPVTSASLAAA
ncbi:MAG: IS110 family transposase [Actinomycetota bacterium]|nr:IS110 family transposase [Actinomycetota bacterium]